jgi:hypothetical protein
VSKDLRLVLYYGPLMPCAVDFGRTSCIMCWFQHTFATCMYVKRFWTVV